ncbi:CxC2 domain-containing protein [Mycena kentingensis (nom. inval.)]|nr:CxC2 domain-containing protein [Mycena kentingensis (nom. inval.)]
MSRKPDRKQFHAGGLGRIQFQSDRSVSFSGDGLHARTTLLNSAPVVPPAPEPVLNDAFGNWTPFQNLQSDELVQMANAIASEPLPVEEDDEHDGKRARDHIDPMERWRTMIPAFLDELTRHDGLGPFFGSASCASCGSQTQRPFRCLDCGPFLQCEGCLRTRHEQLPLHIPQVWNDSFWEAASLYKPPRPGGVGLGMVHQLGHHGFACPHPEVRERELVVVDVHGILRVTVRFCDCTDKLRYRHGVLSQLLKNGWYPATIDEPATCATLRVLDLFRLLRVVGNMNSHDFVSSLERLTDPTFTTKLPDRYKAFTRMARQYDFLLRAKRAGRGYESDGIATTAPGGLAVVCWACPDPLRNLPEGWDTVGADKEYLYSLILAMDANFRLKNRIRGNERPDPSLGSGLSYFVALDAYKEHLRHYVAEEDVSTCIAFAALMQKETRLTTGLRVSGVGGCVCARHGVVRPLGLGDLQKGERYANMDWVFMSAVGGSMVKRLVVSYDIACQWKQRIRQRAAVLAERDAIPTDLTDYEIQYALPVWHAVAHEAGCQAANSLTHAVGVGRTDGEGIERTWAVLNPISFSTKEMGEGHRHDTIDGKVDHINFEKNVNLGDTLSKRLIIAIAARDQQVAEFEEVDESVEPSLRREWEQRVEMWNEDPSQPNPYVVDGSKATLTEAAVLAEMKKAELEDVRLGRTLTTDLKGTVTAAAFIKGALQLEDMQRRIRFEAKGSTTLTVERSSQLDELRVSFLKKLRRFESQQVIFMPGVAELRAEDEEKRNSDLPPPAAENTKLWLPSDLTELQRTWTCRRGLADMEARLREGQCGDCIAKLRSHLHAKTHLVDARNANAVGQHATTRYGSLIGRVGDRVQREAIKYRDVRLALHRLKGPDHMPHFRELADSDLQVHIESESDAQARAALGRLGSARRSRNEPSVARRIAPVSWIWFVGGDGDVRELHDSVRVQWAKARARRDRWTEEVELLQEEMRRVLRSLDWAEKQWQARVLVERVVDGELSAAMTAYALRQAAVHRRISDSFRGKWSASKVAAVRAALDADTPALVV